MKNQQKTVQKQKKIWVKYPELLIAILVFLIIGFVSRSNWLDDLETGAYDLLLRLKPATEERSDIVIAAIDDAAIAVEGTFPWPRDVLADAILRMRELGAEQVSFDIEYLSPSAKGLNPKGESEFPTYFIDAENEMGNMLYDLSIAIDSGELPPSFIGSDDLFYYNVVPAFETLQSTIETEVFIDYDKYFAQALHFFGNSWLTINAGDVGIEVPSSLELYVRENMLFDDVTAPEGLIAKENELFFDVAGQTKKMTPALESLMRASDGAGFTNIILDGDGTRRRVELLHENGGQYIAQLVFAPLLYTLDAKSFVREDSTLLSNGSLTVKDALMPGETERRDIVIPLDAQGRFLVNWIPDTFKESFKNESLLFLHNMDEMEDALVSYLYAIMGTDLGLEPGYFSSFDASQYLLSYYTDLEAMKKMLMEDESVENTREDPRYDEYFSRRAEFFEYCDELTSPFYKDEYLALIDSQITDENRLNSELAKQEITDLFDGYATQLADYNAAFAASKAAYDGAFVIVGHTASNSTDLGTTPFEGQYPNVGTHANVYNTIMNEDFITPISRNITMLISFVMLLLYALTSNKVGSAARNITGIITIFAVPVIAIVCIQFNYYIPLVSTLFNVILAYVGILLWHFFTAESDKRFLRQSFETYLSDDVVEEIVASGVKPELGGEERNVTALFSDIKAFSSFSEQLSATQLVEILNNYLSALSDEILVQRGTIDKYIGDAIVAIFGAPIPMEDHAWRACVSAIRMKQAEEKVNEDLKEINENLIAEGKPPIAIQTRIGLNTGDIVVGNMGTQKKMNYTMMGDDVNLAARLEGVNKSYSSWILVSETTWEAADSGENKGKLLGRRLDRVRVVGRTTPVQLYNIVGLREEVSAGQIECVEIFHRGLDLYLEKKFKEAKAVFKQALALYPEDGPSEAFVNRCNDFIKKGVPENWNGILNMTSK